MGFGEGDAGGQVLKIDFGDPKTTTLLEFFEKYAEEKYPETDTRLKPTSQEIKAGKPGKLKYVEDRKKYLNGMKRINELHPYFDKPMHEMYKVAAKDPSKNPLRLFRDRSTTENMANTTITGFRKYFSAIQDNYIHGIANYGGGSTKLDAQANAKNIKQGIVFPPKSTKKAATYKPNHRKGGELSMAIAKWAKANPDKIETAQAALFLLHTGLRPDEMENIKVSSLISHDDADEFGETRSHRGYLIYDAKNDKWTDAPAGPRGFAIFQQQLERLKNKGIKLKGDQYVFPNTKSADVTNMLKEIKVPQLRQKVIDGKITWLDHFDDAKDFRRFFLTSVAKIPGITPAQLARSTGRDVTAVMKGAGSIDEYVGFVMGDYEPWEYEAVRKNDVKFTLQLTPFVLGKASKDQIIDMNVDLVKAASKNLSIPTVPIDQPQVINPLVNKSDIDVTFGGEKSDKKIESKPINVDDPTDFDSWITKKDKNLKGYGTIGAITGTAAFGTATLIGKKVLAQIPPIGAGMEAYDAYVNKGLGVAESAVRGLSEFAPVSIADVEMGRDVGQWLAKNRDFYEAESKKGFEKARRMLRERNQLVQSGEEQSFLSGGQQ